MGGQFGYYGTSTDFGYYGGKSDSGGGQSSECGQANDVIQAALANLLGPKKVQGDAGSVEIQSGADQIALLNYLAARCAATTRTLGIRYTRTLPMGTVYGGGPRYPRWRDGSWYG